MDLLDRAAERFVARQRAEQHLAVAANRAEQGVEIMRHTAGQPADGFHLLGLADLGLQPQALGDVVQHPQEEHFVAVADFAHRELQGEGRAVAAPAFDLPADADDSRLAGRQVAREVAVVLRLPGRRHEDLDVLFQQLLGGITEHLLDRRIDQLDDAGGIDEHDAVENGIEHRLEPLRALLQRLLNPPALGDVAGRAGRCRIFAHRTFRISQDFSSGLPS